MTPATPTPQRCVITLVNLDKVDPLPDHQLVSHVLACGCTVYSRTRSWVCPQHHRGVKR